MPSIKEQLELIRQQAAIDTQERLLREREAQIPRTLDEANELIGRYHAWFGRQKGKKKEPAYIRVLATVQQYFNRELDKWEYPTVYRLQLFVNKEIYDNQNIPIEPDVYRYLSDSFGYVKGQSGNQEYATLTLQE